MARCTLSAPKARLSDERWKETTTMKKAKKTEKKPAKKGK
jgi:hypothetical protein